MQILPVKPSILTLRGTANIFKNAEDTKKRVLSLYKNVN
jgi:hypothetical protein